MEDPPIKLGSILFTVVEPHKGLEVAYNRWYERDHFYAGCMIGEYTFAGQRWVATRDLKDRRVLEPGAIAPDALTGSYLALYWILAGHHEEWGRWAYKQLKWLHSNGRMFEHRDHVHTMLYRHTWAAYRDEDPVPAELALDHRFSGLAAVIGEAQEPATSDEVDAWYRDDVLPDLLAGSPIASCLAFAAIPLATSGAPGVKRDTEVDRRFLHLYFLDEDPGAAWDAHLGDIGERLAGKGTARLLWGSPFRPTVPGTDTYTDQLW